jgi:hypothetical protein
MVLCVSDSMQCADSFDLIRLMLCDRMDFFAFFCCLEHLRWGLISLKAASPSVSARWYRYPCSQSTITVCRIYRNHSCHSRR